MRLWLNRTGLGLGTEFYENGRLKSCKLARDFGALKRGARFVQAQ